MDIGMVIKLMKNPSDLPSAAKALGMEHTTLKTPGVSDGPAFDALRAAFERLAGSAQLASSEVIELAGAPSALKGKRIRILAVLEAETNT